MSVICYGLALTGPEGWLFVPLLICSVLWLIGWLSGWRALAETYPMRDLPLEPIEWYMAGSMVCFVFGAVIKAACGLVCVGRD